MRQPNWGWLNGRNQKWAELANAGKVDLILAGHLHRLEYIRPGSQRNEFPVLVVGQDQIAHVDASSQALHVTVVDRNGTVLKSISCAPGCKIVAGQFSATIQPLPKRRFYRGTYSFSSSGKGKIYVDNEGYVRSGTQVKPEKKLPSCKWIVRAGTVLILSGSACHSVAKAYDTRAKLSGDTAVLGNELIKLWVDAHLSKLVILAPGVSRTLPIGNAFSLRLKDGSVLQPSTLAIDGPLRIQELQADRTSSQLAKTFPGKSICAEVLLPQGLGTAQWCAIMRDGSSYIRQELLLQAGSEALPIASVTMLDFVDPDARVDGSVKGSPIVDETMYFGFEHPLSSSEVENGRVTVKLPRDLPLKQRQTIRYSSVIGIAPAGQMRRAFLSYLERERAHPYRTFLHYNTWYDLGFRNRFDEAGTLDRIHAFGEELVRKRNVVMDSFLLDDGWDDANTVWGFNSGFPDGLSHLREAAAKYNFGIGIGNNILDKMS